MKTRDSLELIAMAMFNAYNEEGPTPWKTFDGRDVPRWDDLTDAVRGKWVAAADQAITMMSESLAAIMVESVKSEGEA